jgi:hypothetical protein
MDRIFFLGVVLLGWASYAADVPAVEIKPDSSITLNITGMD